MQLQITSTLDYIKETDLNIHLIQASLDEAAKEVVEFTNKMNEQMGYLQEEIKLEKQETFNFLILEKEFQNEICQESKKLQDDQNSLGRQFIISISEIIIT